MVPCRRRTVKGRASAGNFSGAAQNSAPGASSVESPHAQKPSPVGAIAFAGTRYAGCPTRRRQLLRKEIEMTGLMAGYAVAGVAMLIAASAALTIIYGVGGLGTDEEPTGQERSTKAAA